MNYLEDLPPRVAEVRERIAAALKRSGRGAEAVTIVAVTKTYPASAVVAARDAGLTDVGENRVQELAEKVEVVGRDAVTWHLIGHLQRNKARRALPTFDLLHSLDTVRLARELSDGAVAAGTTVRALVQVNAAREESKSGLAPEALVDALGEICSLPGLQVEGLMTMAPFTEEEAVIRRAFADTRALRDEAARQLPAFRGRELSMGMSNDYEIAVEEGSTLVRLGTVLFGARPT
jgi:pyridoxal phosphate enzyme (YggS family)